MKLKPGVFKKNYDFLGEEFKDTLVSDEDILYFED